MKRRGSLAKIQRRVVQAEQTGGTKGRGRNRNQSRGAEAERVMETKQNKTWEMGLIETDRGRIM